MSELVAVIARPQARAGLVRWPLMVLGLLGLALFGLLTLYAAGHAYMPFDVSIERWVQGVSWGPLVTVFYWFDWLEGARQYVAGIGVIVLVSAFNWRNAPPMLVAAASTFIYTFSELAIQRPRSSADLVRVLRHSDSFSYPSGQMVFFSWVLVLLAACLGRIYLGEHWPSDVIAGLALGLGWTVLALSIHPLSNPSLERPR